MTRVTAGVLAGVVLGSLYGAWSAREAAEAASLIEIVLGRASQGIVNGILAAYFTPPGSPGWRGALTGAAVGVLLGALRGIVHHDWIETVPIGALLGLGCGIAVNLAPQRS